MYDYDSNNILGKVMKSMTGDELVRVFTKMHEQLKNIDSDQRWTVWTTRVR